MLRKIAAVVALVVSLGAIGNSPSLASGKIATGPGAGWTNTNSSAAQNRANLIENVLAPNAVAKVKHLRSIVAPVIPPTDKCRTQGFASPLPSEGYLYTVTNGKVSKYNPATGRLIWQHSPPAKYTYESLAVSANILVVSASGCTHPNNPPSIVAAYNATTGKELWLNSGLAGLRAEAVAISGSYVIAAGGDRSGDFVWVLRLSNGTPVWTNSGCNDDNNPVIPLVVGGLAIVPNQGCDGFEARNLATGKFLWDLPGGGPGGYGFRAGDLSGTAGTHIYAIDSSGAVWDVNAQTGQVEYSLSGALYVLAVDLSQVYAICGSGQSVCAYNISTGGLNWQDNGFTATLAAEADGVLYLGSGQALDATTGHVIKKVWPSTNATSVLAVGNGRIAVVTEPRILDLYGLPGY